MVKKASGLVEACLAGDMAEPESRQPANPFAFTSGAFPVDWPLWIGCRQPRPAHLWHR